VNGNEFENAIANAVVEIYQERQLMQSMEHLLAKALACHRRGECCPQTWADQTISVLRLIQKEREDSHV